ncbi:MAG: LON peptidase substrate-binding domain-containing protein [Thermaurantimonas sp.]|uniref:LON peptidase substrate-binding domain-containing protein n=1 Tax=Thermaurantimonas sp. TaxID=2681568 RepID=UPI00391C9519
MSNFQRIKLFPLRLFLLPGESADLHIYEERYKQLLKDSLKGDRHFGIVLASPLNTRNLGSLVEIIDVIKRYPSGEADIIVKCKELFYLKKFISSYDADSLYPGGLVEELLFDDYLCPKSLLFEFEQYKEIRDEQYHFVDTITLHQLALKLPMSEAEKIEYVKCSTFDSRVSYLKSFIKYLKLIEIQEKNTFHSIYLN